MDRTNVRKWYYAVMDYGVMLKKTHPELIKRSAHYRKQSKFKGSDREVRGKILKLLVASNNLAESDFLKELKINSEKLKAIINQLIKEGFIKKEKNRFSIA